MPMQNEPALNVIETQIENLLEARTRLLHKLAELDLSLQDAYMEHSRLSGRISTVVALPAESLAAIQQEVQRPPPPDPPMEIIVAQVVRTWRRIYTYPSQLWDKIVDDVQTRAREGIQRRGWSESSESPNHI